MLYRGSDILTFILGYYTYFKIQKINNSTYITVLVLRNQHQNFGGKLI